MKKNNKRRQTRTTAAKLEARFDAGQDVLDYFDLSQAVRGDLPPQSVKVNLPAWVLSALDTEADRRGVPRQSLVQFAVVEWLEEQGRKRRQAQKEAAAESAA